MEYMFYDPCMYTVLLYKHCHKKFRLHPDRNPKYRHIGETFLRNDDQGTEIFLANSWKYSNDWFELKQMIENKISVLRIIFPHSTIIYICEFHLVLQ